MGLFRRNDERAMPDPGTPEFDQAVAGTAIRDSRSVSMGEPGWTAPGTVRRIDVPDTGRRERLEELLREHGIDPDRKGQMIDASKVPGLGTELIKLLLDPKR